MRALTSILAASVVLAAAAVQAAPVAITNPGFAMSGDGVTPVDLTGDWVNLYWNASAGRDNVQGWVSAWFGAPGVREDWGGQCVLGDNGNARLVMSGNDWSSTSQLPEFNNIIIAAGTYTLGLDVTTNGHGYGGFSAGFDSALSSDLSTVSVINSMNFSGTSDGGWSTVTAATLVVPEGSPLIGQRLGFYVQNFTIESDGGHTVNGAWLPPLMDNVTLDFVGTTVPEPASMGLLAGASLLMLSSRRRQRAK